MTLKYFVPAAFLALVTLVWTGYKQRPPMEKVMALDAQGKVTRADAVLHPTQGNTVRGLVTFEKVENGIRITADVEGLTPGKHGFHIHEFGDCSAPDGSSAGGHFNPDSMPHGAPNDTMRHAGDLGNLTADEQGVAHYDRIDSSITLSGEHSIIGLAVVIHSGEDDLASQPSGAAGPRIACGVIGIAK